MPLDRLHGVPRRGYVLTSAVENIAKHVRFAVSTVRSAFEEQPQLAENCYPGVDSATPERAAWLAISAWLTGLSCGAIDRRSGLAQAQSWFLGLDANASEGSFWLHLDSALRPALNQIAGRQGIGELLPYILETHGPGSRLSVRRDPSTRAARESKKAGGVFYTPPDVAAFMAKTVFREMSIGELPKVLDPAVGTGVFLRAALVELKAMAADVNAYEIALQTLHGCDIDPVALDGAASVLFADTHDSAPKSASCPFEAWKALRGNMKLCDALLLDRETRSSNADDRFPLSELFPFAKDGFDLIIGNPPYADMGARLDLPALAARFRTVAAKPEPTANLYPAFVEQMVRLAGPNASGAMVLPLSVACNSGPQFAALREFMQELPGEWRFAFFDRQPHALFGEDVKTRNAIVFRSGSESPPGIRTGPLRRWRGDDRRAMFQQIDYTPVGGDIRSGIPKIHGPLQAAAWERLQNESVTLAYLAMKVGRITLDRTPDGTDRDVYVAPTAYNFLGLSRPCALDTDEGETLSLNPLTRLTCRSAMEAEAAFAILSSNFAFWWWNVVGDGFHVNRGALAGIPIGRLALAGAQIRNLSTLGRALWRRARRKPVRSINRQRISYAFSSAGTPKLRRQADEIMVASLKLPTGLISEFEAFTETMTTARLFSPWKTAMQGSVGDDHKNCA